MLRRIMLLLSILSLAGTLAFWAWSHGRTWAHLWSSGTTHWEMRGRDGSVSIYMYWHVRKNGAYMGRFAGQHLWAIPLPFPLLTVLFATYPGFVYIRFCVRRHRRVVRQSQGLCVVCEYDLTGNVSGVCPECGTPIERVET